MANYVCSVRTNYFRVKDEEEFRNLMSRVYGEDNVQLWEDKDQSGNVRFAFGTYGGIGGVRNAQSDEDDDCDDSAFDEFIAGLQNCVEENDAVVIFEAGHEKLRYLTGSATIVTSSGYRYLDITDVATKEAAAMLGNPDWTTKSYY